jgi:ATP phosphoribosyltransferase
MTDNKSPAMRLAVPSKGELERPTLDFLAAAGLRVLRPNERQYVASIPSIPDLLVLFQRVPDILVKVDEGSVDLGITGYDVLREQGEELTTPSSSTKTWALGSASWPWRCPKAGWTSPTSRTWPS